MAVTGSVKEDFGRMAGGDTVTRVLLQGGGLTARVMTWGAVIQDLRLEGYKSPLVLGFEHFDDYPLYSPYFGATPGRCANRIAAGKFTLDGTDHQLECNEAGVTHLHGGSDGIARRNWQIVDLAKDQVVLQIVDPDGRSGLLTDHDMMFGHPELALRPRADHTIELRPGATVVLYTDGITDDSSSDRDEQVSALVDVVERTRSGGASAVVRALADRFVDMPDDVVALVLQVPTGD